MARSVHSLWIGLLAGFVLLFVAGTSEAQYRGLRGRFVGRPIGYPNRMPGWDWWRTYPWSPYNYGRNPYNPIVYPYVQPYPVYTPYSMPYDGPTTYYSYGQMPPQAGTDTTQSVPLPNPTGGGTVPPPDGAVVELLIPDQFGTVTFDGVKTSSIGTTRYYVTPQLPGDKSLSYDVTATFRRDGETVTEERNVKVSPGKTSVVDFTKPEKAK
jgi:uncharacterized protein (TIGR03000 family)